MVDLIVIFLLGYLFQAEFYDGSGLFLGANIRQGLPEVLKTSWAGLFFDLNE